MLHKPITSPRITSFISYMWIASLSQEHGTADTAHGILYMHIRTCALSQRGSVMFLFHIAAELTLRHQADVWEWRGRKKENTESVLAGDLLFREKTKREKQREKERKCLLSPWYYLSMWQLLQCRMKDAGGSGRRRAPSYSVDAIQDVPHILPRSAWWSSAAKLSDKYQDANKDE